MRIAEEMMVARPGVHAAGYVGVVVSMIENIVIVCMSRTGRWRWAGIHHAMVTLSSHPVRRRAR